MRRWHERVAALARTDGGGLVLDAVADALEVGFETVTTRLRYVMSELRSCMGADLGPLWDESACVRRAETTTPRAMPGAARRSAMRPLRGRRRHRRPDSGRAGVTACATLRRYDVRFCAPARCPTPLTPPPRSPVPDRRRSKRR